MNAVVLTMSDDDVMIAVVIHQRAVTHEPRYRRALCKCIYEENHKLAFWNLKKIICSICKVIFCVTFCIAACLFQYVMYNFCSVFPIFFKSKFYFWLPLLCLPLMDRIPVVAYIRSPSGPAVEHYNHFDYIARSPPSSSSPTYCSIQQPTKNKFSHNEVSVVVHGRTRH